MFDKILIANRGEIACRIIKTARAMGVRTVAVYSDADAKALHVTQADEAVRLGPAPVAESYLRGDLIIAAAQMTGAEAIHPGYGFLSENPDFVDAVTAAGLTFIGPSADAIRAMGLKDAAKALMHKAGVPVVPGYHGDNQDPDHLAVCANQIGYPVLIKAVAGGGGKGMRLVTGPDQFEDALRAARTEAQTAFGNADVLIEKFIQSPRHIEVQVFGDGTDAIHLFERDCSLQRRHQKVIEEAPAPGMTHDVRAAMGQAAVTAAMAIGYTGAGTVEFIVDGAGPLRTDGFWFMEMNTRLQVEHPVTEAITGIDLVAWQLHVASGAPLPMQQEQVAITGHAFEARLYAEDVPAGFLPATGRIDHLAFPSAARVDTGVVAGDEISPFYDPMIAKITVTGANRTEALRKLAAALDQTHVAGLTTNRDFLRSLARDKGFVEGQVDTGLIAARGQALVAHPEPTMTEIAVAAVLAADLPAGPLCGFSLWAPLCRTLHLAQADRIFEVSLRVITPDEVAVACEGQSIVVPAQPALPAVRVKGFVTVFGDATQRFEIVDPLIRHTDETGGDQIVAPMPGLVTRVHGRPGQPLVAGDPLVVLEAMKMEHVLRAPRDGVLADVIVQEGAQVAAGDLLVALEPEQ